MEMAVGQRKSRGRRSGGGAHLLLSSVVWPLITHPFKMEQGRGYSFVAFLSRLASDHASFQDGGGQEVRGGCSFVARLAAVI